MKKEIKMGIFISILAFLGLGAKTEENEWFIASGEDDGFPLIMRARNQKPNGIVSKQYPNSICIAWKYQARENGMPIEKENAEMEDLENATEKLIEKEKIGYLMLVFTCNGKREWHWYAKDEEKFTEILNQCLLGKRKYPIQVSSEIDPEWEEWEKMVELAKPSK